MTNPPCEPESPREPDQDPHVRAALLAALRSGSWDGYHGPHVPELERRLAEFHGVAFAYACCSGTFAIELALRSCGVRAGDEVLLAGYDFPGNFRCIEAVGARPILVDIEPHRWCIDPQAMQHALERYRPRAAIVSHLHGTLADMQTICRLAAEYELAVIEDACQATGAIVQGRMAGTWGDVGVLSFGGSKLLTSGRGGAIVTDRPEIIQRARVHCEQGNHAFPLSELQAAVLLPQLEQLARRNRHRRQQVETLLEELRRRGVAGRFAQADDRGSPSYYKVGWLMAADPATPTRDQFLRQFQSAPPGPADAAILGEGFRGFARRSPRRCLHADELTHSRVAAERTVLLHHTPLLRPSSYLRQLSATIQGAVLGSTGPFSGESRS